MPALCEDGRNQKSRNEKKGDYTFPTTDAKILVNTHFSTIGCTLNFVAMKTLSPLQIIVPLILPVENSYINLITTCSQLQYVPYLSTFLPRRWEDKIICS